MPDKSAQFALDLLGAFRLIAPNGERIEIASRKGMALIAMLAMAKDGERARGWLQDKLWGKREQPQARSSLRRELSNLRKSLNAGVTPLLICEHDRVALDLRQITIDALERVSGTHPTSGEFLEGLDIAGADGFEEWLREQRQILEERRGRANRAEKQAVVAPASQGGRPDHAFLALPDHILDISEPAPGFDGRPALAVLPFRNLTGQEDNDYLSEGISEELIDRLSRLRWLPVIGQTSSFAIDVATSDLREVGRGLGAKYLLEGRLRRSNNEFLLTARLSDAETGYILWSPRIKLSAPHAPGAIEQLVTDLVAVLDTRIDHAQQVRAQAKPCSELNVNELIWRGRWHLNRFTRADSEIARNLFAQALGLDPNSSEALIHATWCLCWSLWAERGSEEEIVEMRRLAHRAIIADCDDSRGHMLAGIAEAWLRQPVRAKALLERALTLNPSLALAHAQLGDCLYLAGEPEKALVPLKTALRLSPNDIHLFFTLGELAVSYCMLAMWDDAVDHADQSLVRRPAYWFAHMVKINALVRSGNLPAATRAFEELRIARPRFELSYIDWIPFVDRRWNEYFIEGVAAASGARPAVRSSLRINRVV